MEVSRELLFFFSALGAFNGFLLGIFYSFFKKPKHISNFFLGTTLICLSIRIGKSVIFYFNHDLAFGYLQFGLTACLFIGPFLYFYFKSIYGAEDKTETHWRLHLLVLTPLIMFVNFAYPFEQNIDLWRPHIINGIYLVWFAYLLASLPYVLKILKPVLRKQSTFDAQGLWDLSIYIGNVLIWAAFFFCGFTSYILGALLFSFMFYLLALQLIFRNRQDFSAQSAKEKYKNKKIGDVQATEILGKLENHIQSEKLYANPNLKLKDLAAGMNILPHTLSQVLNDNLGKSFPKYVNEYRIEEAKRILSQETNLTLEAIGYDCGFNSKSTFYTTFKKVTGLTPAAYQKQQNQGF